MRKLLLLVAVLVGVVACNRSSRENIQPPRALEDFPATVSVQRIWNRNVGDVGGSPGLRMSVTHLDGRLYVANTRGHILVLDAGTGSELSRIDTGQRLATTPAVGEGVVAAGTLDGKLVVFDLASASERFSAQLSSEVIAAPVIADGRVFVRSHDGRIQAFGVDDGRRLWIQEHTVPVLSLRGNGAMLYENGFLFAGLDDGRLVALRGEDGQTGWEYEVGIAEGRTDLERLADLDGDLSLREGIIYAVGMNGQAMAVDTIRGGPLWSRDLSASGGTAIGDHVLVSDSRSHVVALDRASGGTLWTQEGLEHRWLSTPAVMLGNYAVVGDFDGYVHWLNTLDGAFVARERAGRDAIRSTPLVVDNVAYVITVDGALIAYRVGG